MLAMIAGSAHAEVPSPGVVIYQNESAFPIKNWVDDQFYSDLKKPDSLDQIKSNLKTAMENFKPSSAALPRIFPIEPKLIKPVVLPGTQMIKELPDLPNHCSSSAPTSTAFAGSRQTEGVGAVWFVRCVDEGKEPNRVGVHAKAGGSHATLANEC